MNRGQCGRDVSFLPMSSFCVLLTETTFILDGRAFVGWREAGRKRFHSFGE